MYGAVRMRNLGKLAAGAAAAVGLLGATQAGAATVVNAKSIYITSTNDTYMQLTEVLALDFANLNVALAANGGSPTAANAGFGSAVADANDGSVATMYHSSGSAGDFLKITFSGVHTLASLSIVGRTAICCFERDIYDVEIRDEAEAVLFSGTLNAFNDEHVATVTFDRPVTGAVPEPATWAMMILGFGAAGSALRSRRRALA